MKKNIFIIAVMILFISLLFSYTTYEVVVKTSSANYCVACHEMAPMTASYNQDVHSANGRSGVKASCVSCHLPHDNIVNYLYAKAKKGINDNVVHYFGDVDEINWHERRKKRDSYVYDSGCINCHTNYDTNKAYTSKAIQMHTHYKELLNTNKKLTCASCHVEVGHKGLNNILNIYNPIHEIYKEDMLRKKEKIEQELFHLNKLQKNLD